MKEVIKRKNVVFSDDCDPKKIYAYNFCNREYYILTPVKDYWVFRNMAGPIKSFYKSENMKDSINYAIQDNYRVFEFISVHDFADWVLSKTE